jgi:tetratricopeptide (TPR) repeat protein
VHFTQAIEALPYYHQAFYNRGLAWESLGDAAQAELDYREALRYKPDYTSAALALERVLRP